MIFRYFAHAFVDQFAQQSVDRFKQIVPGSEFAVKSTKRPAKRAEKSHRAFEHMMADARRFVVERKLNLFQRARLAQQMQNEAIRNGYPVPLARSIASGVFGMRTPSNDRLRR